MKADQNISIYIFKNRYEIKLSPPAKFYGNIKSVNESYIDGSESERDDIQ